MNYEFRDYEKYLYTYYINKSYSTDSDLFMKLVEEIGEVAEVLNLRDGRKGIPREEVKDLLASELVDVIHFATAIAAVNDIDLQDALVDKDRKASEKYHHQYNFEEFLQSK